MIKKMLIAVVGLAISGCQSSTELQTAVEQATPVPSSVKAAIVKDARDYLVDPYSVRDAEISYMQFNKHSGLHWVCVKANAKNRMGGYSGRQAVEVWVRNGQLAGNLPNSPACNLPTMKWQAFPELEALRNA
ncbi:hypothetical protein [Pararhizobium sp. DWP3-4]|uniref:hypothetical protein n=1 Tax=Pararhizobium sp. DWP3-4 TaxID=2804565 RepID=UPI003CF99D60